MPTSTHNPTPRRGLLAGMRIRIKLIFLHTCFSLALAGILVLALRPAIGEVVRRAESHEAEFILATVVAERARAGESATLPVGPDVIVTIGDARRVGIDEAAAAQLATDAKPITIAGPITGGGRGGVLNAAPPSVVGFDPATKEFILVSVTLQSARDAVVRLYLLMTIALLSVYALVAAALELLVLPQHVYGPIRTLLDADAAVQEGRQNAELIPESAMPRDELGEIMRSRNRSIVALRKHEADLADALKRLEEVATDLKRKNHLLEMARRNMADADRLASLGLMSAGIAHELNTPLAVLKGLVEKVNRSPVSPTEAALMLRVVGRLERLSESLLDFARVRPPTSALITLRPLVDEAWTLVKLDRGVGTKQVELINEVPATLVAWCDGDRIMQVLLNLLRNAVDALSTSAARRGVSAPMPSLTQPSLLTITAEARQDWVSLTITDNGPGIDPDILPRLFEPFASTRLDSKGTGLGLAVAEGIVREHGGVILARNRTEPAGVTGAVFEVMLPAGEGPVRPQATPPAIDSLVAP